MINVFEKLGKTFGIDEFELEDDLAKMGITLRGLTIYVNTGKKHRIGTEDVIRYYAHEAGNLLSGCRTIADITGDWRPIDNLAKQCLEIYKVLKRDELAKLARKFNMEPKGW